MNDRAATDRAATDRAVSDRAADDRAADDRAADDRAADDRAGNDVVRFVALGDSVTAGIGDPVPDGGWRGWAVLLAESLAPAGQVRSANLACTGALTGDVLRDQLPAALAERPNVAAVLVGINDTLRATFDVATVAANLDAIVGTLVSAGAVVLTAKMPDPGQMLRLPRALARPLARRARALGAVTDGIAARYHTCHLDLAARSDVYDREMWSVDRLHPSERGHRALAYLYATMLREAGLPVHRLPERTAGNPPPTRRAKVRWMATSGVRWIAVRSTDLLPYLVRMAVTEWWHQIRGIAHRLDVQLEQEVARVLAVGGPAGVEDLAMEGLAMEGLAMEGLAMEGLAVERLTVEVR